MGPRNGGRLSQETPHPAARVGDDEGLREGAGPGSEETAAAGLAAAWRWNRQPGQLRGCRRHWEGTEKQRAELGLERLFRREGFSTEQGLEGRRELMEN